MARLNGLKHSKYNRAFHLAMMVPLLEFVVVVIIRGNGQGQGIFVILGIAAVLMVFNGIILYFSGKPEEK